MSDRRVLNVPLVEALREAAQSRWSGLLRVNDEGEHVGALVIVGGRMAWATSKYQQDDLAGSLLRAQIIDDSVVHLIRQQFQTLGKVQKLADFLEEEGFLSPLEFRRYLLLHVRGVLFQVLSRAELGTSAAAEQLDAVDELTFSWDELFVEDPDTRTVTVRPDAVPSEAFSLPTLSRLPPYVPPKPSVETANDHDDASGHGQSESPSPDSQHARRGVEGRALLRVFEELRGYRCALVISARGGILAVQGVADSAEAQRIARGATTLLGAQKNVERLVGLGETGWTISTGDRGSMVVQWIDAGRKHAVVVVLDQRGRPGVVRNRIASALESLGAYVGGSGVKPSAHERAKQG